MHTLTATLVTTNPVRCPVCQRPLAGSGVWVVDSLGFCHDCARTCTLDALALEIDCALGCEFVTSYARVHGVILYNPLPTDPTDTTAAQQHWADSVFPYVIPRERLNVAGDREPDPADAIIPQARPSYIPHARRTPSGRV